MKSKEEILSQKIKDNKCFSIDPHQVYDKMKLAAHQAMQEYAELYHQEKLRELKEHSTPPDTKTDYSFETGV